MDKKHGKTECVQVAVRCRPLSDKEKANKNNIIVNVDKNMGQIVVSNPNPKRGEEPPKTFTFDNVFGLNSTQEEVYEENGRTIVESVMKGYNGTIFAYGQTGTGKTFTMEGTSNNKGIIPRTFEQIFEEIDSSQNPEKKFLVRASFIEIYKDDLFDLLNIDDAKSSRERLQMKEHPDKGFFIQGVRQEEVQSVEKLHELLTEGKSHRTTGQTLMNRESSRSHCIFQVIIETCEVYEDGEPHIRAGKLNLVDLAGSERQEKTQAEGNRLQEAMKINLSLSALGNVIAALTKSNKVHIPYRDSKLTKLLMDSLGGNTKTVMIANLGPADYNFDETCNTLRFATRAKKIENKPKINEDPKDARLREYQEEIEKLKAQLKAEEQRLALMGEGNAGLGPITTTLQGDKVVVEKVVKKVVQVGVAREKLEEAARAVELEKEEFAKKTEEEKRKIREEKQRVQEEHQKLRDQISKREQFIMERRQDRESLQKELSRIQNSLVTSKTVLHETKEQLRLKKIELEQKQIEKDKMHRQLRQKEEANFELAGRFESQQQELEVKKKRWEQLKTKYQQIKIEIEDIKASNQKERQEMAQTQRELHQYLQLKDTLLQCFVPNSEKEKILKRVYWDTEKDDWRMHPLNLEKESRMQRPNSQKKDQDPRIPMTNYAKIAASMGDMNPRFHRYNIMDLELDMPDRTTQDYEDEDEEEEDEYYESQEMEPNMYGNQEYMMYGQPRY